MTPKELALIAVKALDEKKGKEISAIEVTHLTTLADFFVIATGTSNTQINALCGAVEKAVKEQAGAAPLHRSGYRDGPRLLLRGPGILRPGQPLGRRNSPGPQFHPHRRLTQKKRRTRFLWYVSSFCF